jgi:hypothetical protein
MSNKFMAKRDFMFAMRNLKASLVFGEQFFAQYARYTAHFFSVLAECGIRPIVVMDGGYEASDIKIK